MKEREAFLCRLAEIVNIDSCSHDPAGITAVADVIAGWFTDLGWQVQRHDLGPETGPLLQITNKGTERYNAVLLGHMDTVFPGGTVAERPFRVEGNVAYGPGVMDMKGGLVAMYFIARALSKDPEHSPAVCMLFNPDEEIGSPYSQKKMIGIVERSPRLYVMEGGEGADALHCYASNGVTAFTAVFRGQSAHAGNILERPGASAILEAARWTETIHSWVDRERKVTANVGVIRGGVAANVVPDYARLRGEFRMAAAEDHRRMLEQLREMAAHPMTPGVTVELERIGGRPPLVASEGTMAEIERIRGIAAGLGQEFNVHTTCGVSDANTICAALPHLICLDDIGPAGDCAHSPQEYLLLDTCLPNVELFTRLLLDLKRE